MVLRLSLKTSKPPCCSSDSHFIYQIHTGGPHTFPSDVVLYVACYVLCLFVILAVSILGFEDRTLTGSVCTRTLLTFHFLLGYYICYETILILIIFASSNSKDRTLVNLSQMLHTLHYMQHALSQCLLSVPLQTDSLCMQTSSKYVFKTSIKAGTVAHLLVFQYVLYTLPNS